MKWTLVAITTLLTISCFAQKPQVTWGDEFKLKKGSTDLEVIHADKNGVYLQEGHLALKSYFVIGASARSSATLIKLDNALGEVYRNDFNKELRGKEFVQFFAVADKMYVFATDYSRKEKTLEVYGAEIIKSSGELAGDWSLVTSFQKDEKGDDIDYKLTLNSDSSRMVIVSTIKGRERNEYTVQEFDKNMRSTSRPAIIANEFEKGTFQLEDVLYTSNKKIVLVGRVFEYQEGKKKKEKFLEFANYNIRIYDEKGKQQKEINTNINGRWLMSSKLVQEKNNDIVLAAFYTNERKGKTVDGLLVQRINHLTGEVISTSEKEINNSLLTSNVPETADDGDESESKAEKKERENLAKIKDEGEAFSKYMRFQRIFYTSDNGLVIIAEKYHHYTHTTRSYTPGRNGMSGSWTSRTYSIYDCGDLLMCKIDAGGNIGWMKVLPKAQHEVNSIGYDNGFGYSGFFDPSGMPYYAGFGAVQTRDAIQILFNDNPINATVTQPGQKVRGVSSFRNAHCFITSVALADGKIDRRMLFSNSDVPTSMPRLGSVIGTDVYIVGREDRMIGKTKIAVAKINLKQ